MFDPNDIVVFISGFSRTEQLGINLDLYSNFSFRDKLHINVLYNGGDELGELECDNFITLSENRGYQTGALDLINASLKGLIESDRNIGVIHNFDFLFFYDNPFKNLIVKLIDSKKYFLGWEAEPFTRPVERKRWESDCFFITKEFAKKLYPISPEIDVPLFYRKEVWASKIADGYDFEDMEERLFRRLVNIIMPEDLGELNRREYSHQMPQQHIARDHDKVMDKLNKYCLSVPRVPKPIGRLVHKRTNSYHNLYHCIHTHNAEVLLPLLAMFKYSTNNKKFKTIDKFINNEISLMY